MVHFFFRIVNRQYSNKSCCQWKKTATPWKGAPYKVQNTSVKNDNSIIKLTLQPMYVKSPSTLMTNSKSGTKNECFSLICKRFLSLLDEWCEQKKQSLGEIASSSSHSSESTYNNWKLKLNVKTENQNWKLKLKSKLWSSTAKIQNRSRRASDTCKQKNRTIVS